MIRALIVLAFLTVNASACDPVKVQYQVVQVPAPSPDVQDPTVVVPVDNCPTQIHTQTIFRLQQNDPSYNYSYTRLGGGFRVSVNHSHFNGVFRNNTVVVQQGHRFNGAFRVATQPNLNVIVNRGGLFNRGTVQINRNGNVLIRR